MASPAYEYDDATVVITGASSGIGRETALRFGQSDATVINADIEESPKDHGESVPTHEKIRELGGQAEYVETDVTSIEDLKTVVEAAHEYGGVDVMINNAAMHLSKPFVEMSPAELDQIMAVNIHGVFFGTQVAALDMINRKNPGVILNTASISSNHAQLEQVQYDATKGAVRMVTRGTSLELAQYGIRVNAVAPGQIATEFFEGWSDKAVEWVDNDELLKPVPLDQAGFPADVAGAYLFLASDDASYITGELLHVDGGWQVC